MENTIEISKKELTDLVETAVNGATKKITDEFEMKNVPNFVFDKNIDELKSSKKTYLVGAFVKSLLMAKNAGHNPESITKDILLPFVEKNYKKTKTLSSQIILKGMNETNAADGEVFIIPEVYNQFIEELTAYNVIRGLGVTNITMTGSQLEINRADTGAGAYWTTENPGVVTKSNPQFGKYILTPKKLMSWATISNDLINDASSNVEQILQDMIIRAAGNAEEIEFITGLGSSYAPKGLLGWTAAGNINTVTGTDAEDFEADFIEAEDLILSSNVRTKELVWLMNHKTLATLKTLRYATTNILAFENLRDPEPTLMGHKVVVTNNIPVSNSTSNIYLFAPEHFVIADRQDLQFVINPSHNDSNFPQGINETLYVATSRVDTLLKYDTACAIITDVAV
jgi:HK97 family phage major capsid protein